MPFTAAEMAAFARQPEMQTVYAVMCNEIDADGEPQKHVFCCFLNEESAYSCAFHEICEFVTNAALSIAIKDQIKYVESVLNICKSSTSWLCKYQHLEKLTQESTSFHDRFTNNSDDEEFIEWFNVEVTRLSTSSLTCAQTTIQLVEDQLEHLESDSESVSPSQQ